MFYFTAQSIQKADPEDSESTSKPKNLPVEVDFTDDHDLTHEAVATNQNDLLNMEAGLSNEPGSYDPKLTATVQEEEPIKDELLSDITPPSPPSPPLSSPGSSPSPTRFPRSSVVCSVRSWFANEC